MNKEEIKKETIANILESIHQDRMLEIRECVKNATSNLSYLFF